MGVKGEPRSIATINEFPNLLAPEESAARTKLSIAAAIGRPLMTSLTISWALFEIFERVRFENI
jgi:hypothetical protein